FFSSRRRHTRFSRDWSSDVCSSDLTMRLDAGKLLIVGIFVFALFAAGFAVWFRSQQGKQALELWGVDTAARIRNAQDVQLLYYRSEERRVGKEGRSRWARGHYKHEM